MRRIISLFTICVLAAGLCSCNDKKKDGKPELPEDEVISETVTEADYEIGEADENMTGVVKEKPEKAGEEPEKSTGGENPADKKTVSSEDFKKINVETVNTGKKDSCSITKYNINRADFGEKLPVCNRAENAQGFYTGSNAKRMISGNDIGYPDYIDWHEYVDKPEEGILKGCFIVDNNIYLLVCYGIVSSTNTPDSGCYDWALFSYDEKSGESRKVYDWSSESIDNICCGNVFNGDEMFFVEKNGDNVSINAVDLNTLEERTVFEKTGTADIFELERYGVNQGLKEDMLLYIEIGDFLSKEPVFTIYCYDSDEDSFKEISEEELGVSESEEATYSISNDKYTFKMMSGNIASFLIDSDDKRVYFSDSDVIETFDIEKQECYVNTLPGSNPFNTVWVSGGKIFFIGNSEKILSDYGIIGDTVKCIIPDLGLVFDVLDGGEYCMVPNNSGAAVFDTTVGSEAIYLINE